MGFTTPILVTLALLLTAAPKSDWVLPPTAEPVVRAFVSSLGPHLAGHSLGARIDGGTVQLVARDKEGKVKLAVGLVHPSAAPAGATTLGGVALVDAPGPVDPALRMALVQRLEGHPLVLPWLRAGAGRPDPAVRLAQDEAAQATLERARYLRAIGDAAAARALLEGLPNGLSAGLWIEVALLWRQLGDGDASRRVAGRVECTLPDHDAAVAILRDQPLDAAGQVGGLSEANACRYASVARLLADLERYEQALAVIDAIRSRAPDCARAWEVALHIRLDQRQKPAALLLARAVVEKFSDDDALLQLAATALSSSEAYREAAPILEDVARRNPEQSGVIRVLLSTVLRNPEFRAEKALEYDRIHRENPDDRLATFLLGVVKHYANDFEASSALLRQVAEPLDHLGRLHIYLAMNDFNLGRVEAALERLDRAAERPVPDPDIFYCRAEILRDRDRDRAIGDLRRYMAPTGVNVLANPEKERRVKDLIALLEACQKDGRASCEGPWEHPRFRHHTESEVVGESTWIPPKGWLAFAAAMLVGGLIVWRRRRAS
jgi:tetratricopeptide (TPR) repeat protein